MLGKAYEIVSGHCEGQSEPKLMWTHPYCLGLIDPWRELSQDFTGYLIHSRGDLRNELTLIQTGNQGHRSKHTFKMSFLICDTSTFGVLVAVGRIHLI